MTQIEIGLGTVFSHEHFTVLKRAHRTGIDVQIRIQLHHRDREAARFEDCGKRSGGDAFAKGGHDAAGDKDIFSHHMKPNRLRILSRIRRGSPTKIGRMPERG